MIGTRGSDTHRLRCAGLRYQYTHRRRAVPVRALFEWSRFVFGVLWERQARPPRFCGQKFSWGWMDSGAARQVATEPVAARRRISGR